MSVAPRAGSRDAWSATAHDVKTPISVISGFAELLLTRDDEATRLAAAEQILAASRRVSSDLDDLVTLMAIADEGLDVLAEPVPLVDVVRTVLASSSGEIADAVVVQEAAPVVQADREHLSRILETLLGCARRPASATDAPIVTITEGRDLGRVSVELDSRSAAPPTRLDLVVARRLAELQGGSLVVENGTRRAVNLTLSMPVANRAPAEISRVLIVEDDPAVRSLLRATMPDDEYEIVEASEGSVGLELALAHDPDLVLLDWRLPGRSGPYVLRELKQQRPHVPVIVLTASTDDEARELAGELGANAFLTKPFSPLGLLDAVERFVA